MIAGVGQPLLDDAVNDVFHDRGQTAERDPAAKIDLRSLVEGRIVDQMGDGGHDARFVEDRRPHAADEPPGLGVALAGAWPCRASKALAASFGFACLKMVVDLELHDRPGQLLGQSVVDVVGDQLPFVVAGLEHVLESSAFPLQGLLGLLASVMSSISTTIWSIVPSSLRNARVWIVV